MMHLCMLADSGLMRDLQQHVFPHGGQPMFRLPRSRPSAKGAPSGPFGFGVLADKMKSYNTAMSAVRSSVEWLFADRHS